MFDVSDSLFVSLSPTLEMGSSEEASCSEKQEFGPVGIRMMCSLAECENKLL